MQYAIFFSKFISKGKKLKVLGIDPALSSLGWGVIQLDSPKILYIDSGTIKTTANTLLHLRLYDIASSIEEVINNHQPEIIAMEETFVNLNAASSLKLGYVRGAILSVIGSTKLPFYEYAPNNIKKTLVGTGHAQKEQVQHMVKMILSGSKKTMCLDESDALAVAYTCLVNQSNV